VGAVFEDDIHLWRVDFNERRRLAIWQSSR
jgi:hypothetical protein